jgi:hypothetical protein
MRKTTGFQADQIHHRKHLKLNQKSLRLFKNFFGIKINNCLHVMATKTVYNWLKLNTSCSSLLLCVSTICSQICYPEAKYQPELLNNRIVETSEFQKEGLMSESESLFIVHDEITDMSNHLCNKIHESFI